MPSSSIYIGPAGWSYPDWKRIFYPARLPTGQTELIYLSQFFNLVEINSSFYRIPTPQNCENWVHQVQSNPDFRFVCKLNQNFTHQADPLSPDEILKFKTAIMPLQDAGRLLTVLVQFPWSFKNNPVSRTRLYQLIEAFSVFPLSIEVRHASWDDPGFRQYLQEQSVSLVNIDQPVIGQSLPLTTYRTTPLVYFRFHGRNYEQWFREDAGRNQRYDYLYSDNEQQDFLNLISQLIRGENVMIMVFNNHFRGQAIANALQLQFHFDGKKRPLPETLRQVYPQLNVLHQSNQIGENLDLFDMEF